MYTTDKFFDTAYERLKAVRLSSFDGAEAVRAEIAARRARLRDLLALDRLSELFRKPSVKCIGDMECEAELAQEFKFPVWTLLPDEPNGNTVLYLSGHDKYGARGSFNDYGQQQPFHHWLPLRLKESGYTVVIPELVGFGDMRLERFGAEHGGCYGNAALAQLLGLNIEGIRVYQALSVTSMANELCGGEIDFLYGISGGGLIAALTSALCETLKGVVVSNYGAEYRTSIMAMRHCIDNYIPSMVELGSCADLIALGAPVPLLYTNGRVDRIFPIKGTEETAAELRKIYSLIGAEDKLTVDIHNGGHEANVCETVRFFDGL